jgi:hypothetical protein
MSIQTVARLHDEIEIDLEHIREDLDAVAQTDSELTKSLLDQLSF